MKIALFLTIAFLSAASAEEPKPPGYELVLVKEGDSKVQTVKVVREVGALGLKQSLDLVNGAPKTVKSGLSKEDGEKHLKAFEAIHAKAELRDVAGKVIAATAAEPEVAGKFDLVLKSFPEENKMFVIRIVKDVTGLGLDESKKLVESAPVTVKSGMAHDEAQKQKRLLEANKAQVEVKESAK